MKFLFTSFLLTALILPFHSTFAGVKVDKNIFFEFKSAELKNQESSNTDDWKTEKINTFNGQIGFDLNLWGHNINSSVYIRHNESNILNKDYVSQSYQIFPETIVARNIFKMNHIHSEDSKYTETILNQFNYQWGDDEAWLTAGRMIIDFGEGFFSNPINPLNINSKYSHQINVNQSNDGLALLLGKNDKLKLHIFLLGDKSYTDYDEKITRTLLLRGDWKINQATHINYILGEDQKRHKYGIELQQKIEENRIGYLQMVKYSQNLENEDPNDPGIFHYLIGYKFDPNPFNNLRLEFGKTSREINSNEYSQLNYLPFEAYWGVVLTHSFSDQLFVEAGFSQDTDTDFRYYKISSSYIHNKNARFKLFHSAPVKDAEDDPKYASQAAIPSLTGASIELYF